MALKIRFNAPVILGFALLSTAVLALNLLTNNFLLPIFALNGSFNMVDPFFYIGLLTYPLGHSGPEHWFGNISLLLLVGPIMEEKYGSKNMLTMILLTTVLSGILHVIFFSYGLVGASGVVFMLIVLISFANVRSGEIPLTFVLVVLLYLGREVVSYFQADNISQFAHIIGGALGGVFGFASQK